MSHVSWDRLYYFQQEAVVKLDGEQAALIADDMGLLARENARGHC